MAAALIRKQGKLIKTGNPSKQEFIPYRGLSVLLQGKQRQFIFGGWVFSGEFCEIFKNTFFHRTPLVAPSGDGKVIATIKDPYLFAEYHFWSFSMSH